MADLSPDGVPTYKVGTKEVRLRKLALEISKVRTQDEEQELRIVELHEQRSANVERIVELRQELAELEASDG